jgi:hypothetical protein
MAADRRRGHGRPALHSVRSRDSGSLSARALVAFLESDEFRLPLDLYSGVAQPIDQQPECAANGGRVPGQGVSGPSLYEAHMTGDRAVVWGHGYAASGTLMPFGTTPNTRRETMPYALTPAEPVALAGRFGRRHHQATLKGAGMSDKRIVAKAEMLIRNPVTNVFEAFVDPVITPSSGSAVVAPNSKREKQCAGTGKCMGSRPRPE